MSELLAASHVSFLYTSLPSYTVSCFLYFLQMCCSFRKSNFSILFCAIHSIILLSWHTHYITCCIGAPIYFQFTKYSQFVCKYFQTKQWRMDSSSVALGLLSDKVKCHNYIAKRFKYSFVVKNNTLVKWGINTNIRKCIKQHTNKLTKHLTI